MKSRVKYFINKDVILKETKELFNSKLKGYSLSKKKVINNVKVSKIVILDSKLIENAINRKINKKIKSLLEILATICEDDENPSSGIKNALNEIERFRRIIMNEFVFYMNNKQLELIEKKLNLVEQEIKQRLYQYNQIEKITRTNEFNYQEDYSEEKTSHRRR